MRTVLDFPRVVDDVSVRVVAGLVLVVVLATAVTGWWWLFAVLAVDFWLRVASGPRFSPLAHLTLRVIRPRLPAAPRDTPGPPKRFAALMGAVLTTAIAVLFAVGAPTAAWVLGVAMVVFPALEAFVGLCVGCTIFAFGMRVGLVPESVCVECRDITLRQRSA
ncbi:MAG TPA: DUF4395 domain-containing protein [Actinomycetales bacterium]|nr:DUF4395 domain-containing protein [Actinomycetales bacterium]